ncbi:MAG: SpoIIE family protein phosphatase [Firmicutes bacterium]|nr:SpoIIE family protein phosphatase [Bacillota bacterium]
MSIKLDVSVASLSKQGEEVCGDSTEVIKTADATTVILSDGMGSGIKASILSILTTRIASRLLQRKIGLDQVFETIADTLPVCKVRGIAYSTLSVLRVSEDGSAHLIEYDNPPLILLSNNRVAPVEGRTRQIAGKDVAEAFFQVKPGDLLILASDGITNAGVGGGLFKLGIGDEGLADNIISRDLIQEDAAKIAEKVMDLVDACYLSTLGDDSTVVIAKARTPRVIILLTGPPEDARLDHAVVSKLLGARDAKRIICGGATANMVAREMNRPLRTSLEYEDPSVPPIASIEGVDMVTEGILTLNKCIEKLENTMAGGPLRESRDGATLLAGELLKADKVTFLVGKALNPAHEELMRSVQLMPSPTSATQAYFSIILGCRVRQKPS